MFSLVIIIVQFRDSEVGGHSSTLFDELVHQQRTVFPWESSTEIVIAVDSSTKSTDLLIFSYTCTIHWFDC
jgi:hypothetical protein